MTTVLTAPSVAVRKPIVLLTTCILVSVKPLTTAGLWNSIPYEWLVTTISLKAIVLIALLK